MYAAMSRPLTQLTRKATKWTWTAKEEVAFLLIKRALAGARVLRLVDSTRPLILTTDASLFGIGAELSQLDEDGHEHACGWYSALLTPAMTKWATSDRELWALVASSRHWRVHLQRGHFVARVDHNPLVHIVRRRLTINSRATRWLVWLQTLAFTVVHRPGRLMGMADALSRAGAATGSGAEDVPATASAQRYVQAHRAFGDASDVTNTAIDELLQQWRAADGARGVHDRALRRHALEELTTSLTEAANDVALDHCILLRDRPAVVTPGHAKHAADIVVAAGQTRATAVRTVRTFNTAHLVAPHKQGPVVMPNAAAMLEAQQQDARTAPILLALRQAAGTVDNAGSALAATVVPVPPRHPDWSYCLHKDTGVLSVNRTFPAGRRLVVPVVPTTQRDTFLQLAHDLPCSGHGGRLATAQRLARLGWWPGVQADVHHFVDSCIACQCRKRAELSKVLKMRRFDATEPRQSIGVDLVGPFRVSHGCTHVVSIIDRYTRYPVFVAVPSHDAVTVARAVLDNWIAVFGVCSSMVTDSDNGKEFSNAVWTAMANQLGVSALHTTSYHSQTNGATERQHQVLERCLTHLVNEQHDDWSEHLQLVAMSMRSAHNRVIGISPFEAMFGTPMQLPLGVTTYPADNDASGTVWPRRRPCCRPARGVVRARRPDHAITDALQVPHGEGLQPAHGPTRDALRRG